ncbi:hypothetical protein GIB67_024519 [Kingdonia uniflora]|uniref:Mitochondrial Rho GTPase 1/3 EF hand associated type-1 domain-containing protein n=1 Tax=Kingdonia uniflora TaxID=39325 RepID=A0A7J7LP06_9MAGN|nr:hypothetical protein GIB67_024519 [Kingdonia uniflora]
MRALQPAELGILFSTALESPLDEAPYKNTGEISPLGGMFLDGLLSKWALMKLLELYKSLYNLFNIGYQKDPASALCITKRRGIDFIIVKCIPWKTGRYNSTSKEYFTIKCLDHILGTSKTIVLREIPKDDVEHLMANNESLADCDVDIFVHDSFEKSWNKATDLLFEVANHAKDRGFKDPCLIVTAKDDLDPYGKAIQKLTWESQQIGLQ